VDVVALVRRVCFAKMGDQFLSNESTLNFCMKLGKNASDTCATLSEAYGGEDIKKSSV
jgi:hypothetical protein